MTLEISAQGRYTASLWHSGQWSALYSISSTGTVWDNTYRTQAEFEIEKEIANFDWNQDDAPELFEGLNELLAEVREVQVINDDPEEDAEEVA